MQDSEIQRLDREVLDKIHTLTHLVRICGLAGETKSFISECDHMVGIQALDVRTGSGGPFGQDIGVAALAAGLVGQLPGKDSWRVGILGDDSLNVLLILSLGLRVGIPALFCSTESRHVRWHASIVAPVVREVDYELYSTGFGGLDDIVETLETIRTCVDGRSGCR